MQFSFEKMVLYIKTFFWEIRNRNNYIIKVLVLIHLWRKNQFFNFQIKNLRGKKYEKFENWQPVFAACTKGISKRKSTCLLFFSKVSIRQLYFKKFQFYQNIIRFNSRNSKYSRNKIIRFRKDFYVKGVLKLTLQLCNCFDCVSLKIKKFLYTKPFFQTRIATLMTGNRVFSSIIFSNFHI